MVRYGGVGLLAGLLSIAALSAQRRPDFSGTWILDPEQPTVGIPQRLLVSQSLVSTNVRGEPMPPYFRDITVTRVNVNSTNSETYRIGLIGGTVGDDLRTQRHVAWADQALVFEANVYTGLTLRSGEWNSRREVWSLEPNGRLRIAITIENATSAAQTVVSLYRRVE